MYRALVLDVVRALAEAQPALQGDWIQRLHVAQRKDVVSALSALAARISQRFRGKTQRVDRLDQFATQLHCGADAFAGLYELRQRVRLETYGSKEVCEGVLARREVTRSGGEHRQALVALNRIDRRRHDVYRVDLRSGAMTLDTENPGGVVQWVSDERLCVRAAVATTPDGGTQVLVRISEEGWRPLLGWSSEDDGRLVSVSQDGATVYVLSSHGANAQRLVAIDMTSGAERVLAEDGSYDVTEVLTHPTTRAPEAAAFHRERIEWQALETSAAERLATLRRAVPGQLAVVSQDVADARWIAIMGASYGGYAALAGLAFHPEVFAAGISVVGPSNLVSLLQSIPPHWAPVRAMFARRIGDPESEADFLRTRSPLFAAERIEAPLLVCQGRTTRGCPAPRASRWWRRCGRPARRWSTGCTRTRARPDAPGEPAGLLQGGGALPGAAPGRPVCGTAR